MLFSNVDYTPYLYQLKNNMLIIPTKCKQQKYKCDKYHIYILFNFKIMFFSNKFYFLDFYIIDLLSFLTKEQLFLQTYHLP